jgi:hypothetical protein
VSGSTDGSLPLCWTDRIAIEINTACNLDVERRLAVRYWFKEAPAKDGMEHETNLKDRPSAKVVETIMSVRATIIFSALHSVVARETSGAWSLDGGSGFGAGWLWCVKAFENG